MRMLERVTGGGGFICLNIVARGNRSSVADPCMRIQQRMVSPSEPESTAVRMEDVVK